MKTPDFVTDIKAGSKTIEDIKKWLACWAVTYTDECSGECETCEYDVGEKESVGMGGKTLAYIQQLEAGIDHAEKVARECAKSITENLDKLQSRLAQVERERAAAVKIIEDATTYLEDFGSVKFALMQLKKWRGVCEGNTKEEGK